MPMYYTEYPKGKFWAATDKLALLTELHAKIIYRESDTPDGKPFQIIRDTHSKDD